MHTKRKVLRLATMVAAGVAGLGMAATLLPAASADVAPGPLETASGALDHFNVAGWWSPMAEFDGRAYLAYNYDYLPDEKLHEVWVARRDGANSFEERGCMPASGGECARFPDDEGHNQPSIAIDGDGYIHAFVSMHNNEWRYFRSARPEDPTEFVNVSAEMPDQDLGFTYPNLATAPDGDVWLIARSRSVPGRAGGRLYHWDNTNDAWSLVTPFAYQAEPERRTVYPDDIDVTPDGDVHIAFQWAHDAFGIRHEGSYLRYSPSENAFYAADGNQVDVPVTPSTPGLIYQPLEPGEVYGGQEGVQSAKLSMSESAGGWTPTIAYRYKDPADPARFEVERATFQNGEWSREQVFGGPADTHAALDITNNGETERIYYTTTGSSGTAYVAESPSGGGEWTHTEIADGKPVERLSVLMRPNGTDWAYLAAPTAISERRGELYFRTLGR